MHGGLAISRNTRRALEGLLVLEVAGIIWLVLDPSPATPTAAVTKVSTVLAAHGVPAWAANASLWEYLLNVALFVPLGFLAALRWRRVPLWGWVTIAFAISTGVELFQLMFLNDRTAQLSDVSSNTLGGFLGAALGKLVVQYLFRRGGGPVQRDSYIGEDDLIRLEDDSGR